MKWYGVLIGVWILGGCASHTYTTQTAALILLKTPTVRFADMGFVYESREEVKVEVYSSGHAQMALRIGKERTCLSQFACMENSRFNQEVLHAPYPPQLLSQIFRGEVIWEGRGLKRERNGFTQQIKKSGKYQIAYTVLSKETIFRDTINKILIKVKK